MSVVRQ